MSEPAQEYTLQPRWISLKEACRYGNIGKDRLKMLAIRGTIKGAPDPDSKRGDWIFDRFSIDQYREGQMPTMTARQKALEIVRGMGL